MRRLNGRNGSENLRTASVWEAYRRNSTKELRKELLAEYWPLVQDVAQRLAYRLRASVEVGDLASYGVLGLINAIERFDPAKKAA